MQTHGNLNWDMPRTSVALGNAAASPAKANEYNANGSTPFAKAVVNPMDDWQTAQFLVEKAQELESQLQSGVSAVEAELGIVRDRLAAELRLKVCRLVQRIVRDRELAEDIVQIALLQILYKLGNYDHCRAPFRCWATRVVIHTVYHELVRSGRIQSAEVSETDLLPPDDLWGEEMPAIIEATPASEEPIPEQLVARERLERILGRAKENLSEDEYLVWRNYLDGCSHAETAMLLNRREDWVRQTLHRAREKVAAVIVLDPHILSNEEIEHAIARCQQTDNPLSDAELNALRHSLQTNPRHPPGWRKIALFRQACLKILPYVL